MKTKFLAVFILNIAAYQFSFAENKIQLSPKAFNCVLGANIVGSIIENKKKHFSSNAIENLIFGSDLPPAQKHYLRGFSELVAKNDVTKIEPFIVINSYYADCMK